MDHYRPSLATAPTLPWFAEEQIIETLNESSDVHTSAWVRNRRPVYALAITPGPQGDRLLIGHTRSSEILVYEGSPLEETGLLIRSLPLQSELSTTHTLRVGDLLGSPLPDLVAVSHSLGIVQPYEGIETAPYFKAEPAATIQTEGRARDVVLTDVTGDGQNDLAVVLRDAHLLAVYANQDGKFSLISESVLGVSPRVAVASDFDGDARVDLAVVNRHSADVSILNQQEGGSGWLTPRIYSGAGDPIGEIHVQDFDQDGLDDRLFVAENTGEIGISYSEGEGNLGEWQRYDMGGRIADAIISDIDGDGWLDILATVSKEPFVSILAIRYGSGEAHFHDFAELSGTRVESTYWRYVSVVDLDDDGDGDLLALTQHGDLALFEQHEGTFLPLPAQPVIEAPRDLRSADLDDDGDDDLAILSLTGTVVLIENTQNWLNGDTLPLISIETGQVGSTNFAVQETAPKLIVGNTKLLGLHRQVSKFEFEARALASVYQDPRSEVTSFENGVFVSLTDRPCELAYEAHMSLFGPNRRRSIPPTTKLASGDLDGDGRPDLVGSGTYYGQLLAANVQTSPYPLRLFPGLLILPKLSSTRSWPATKRFHTLERRRIG
jgi:hypothetical protein